MLTRYRRRQNALTVTEPGRSRAAIRIGIVVVVLLIVWYIVSQVFSLFESALGKGTGAVLTLRGSEGVDVSLQDGDYQRAETNLKLYPGDSVRRRSGAEATVSFFDGTKMLFDQSTEAAIDQSTLEPDGTSKLRVDLRSGRLFVSTPSAASFTGAIARSVVTDAFSAEIPADAAVIVGSSLVHVVRAAGLGVKLSLTFPDRSVSDVVIGEGQYISFSEEMKAAVERGEDPYDFRDPATEQLRRDPFLIAALERSAQGVSLPASSGKGTVTPGAQTLTVESPANRQRITAKTFRVSGSVSEKVALLLVNGQAVAIGADRSFSTELSLGSGPTTNVRIEAQDAEGIPLAIVERTVENAFQVNVEPVRIKSPVGSGETLRTSALEVEITGEAPLNTNGIVVNDYRLQLFRPGARTWSYLASIELGNLRLGENVYTVYALDADGNRSPGRSITIVYEGTAGTGTGSVSQPPLKQNAPLTPGVLLVTKPVAGTEATVDEKEVVIAGRTSSETFSISVNGYTLSLYKPGVTTWNYIASTDLSTMKRGKNVYRIVARNSNGEILDVLEYTITFRP